MDPEALELPGGFDFRLRTRLVYGEHAVDRLGQLAAELGARRALLVTDPGVAVAGHADRAGAALESEGLEVVRFQEVRENPNCDDVEACRARAAEVEPELLVAVGGGSSIDTAKGANFVLTNGGVMEDYWGVGKARRPMLPMIAVPTTAGTGSEVQSFALVERARDHQKMACGDPKAAPRVALLDPSLTASVPPFVAACTGLDALTHAVESQVTRARNPISGLFAREAFRLASASLPGVLGGSNDLESRGAMLRAAAFAGLAIEASMLGAAHSMANPLTAHHGVPHGQAVGTVLPHVVRFNAGDPEAAAAYRELASAAGLCGPEDPPARAVEALVGRLIELLRLGGLPASLTECGVEEHAVGELAQEAARQWTARYNPRAVAPADFEALYRAALAGA